MARGMLRNAAWVLGACLLLLAGGRPARAAAAPPRFFAGSAAEEVTDPATPSRLDRANALLALDGRAIYGLIITDPNFLDRGEGTGGAGALGRALAGDVYKIQGAVRLYGRLKGSKVRGRLFDGDNRDVGSFRGKLTGRVIRGTWDAGRLGSGQLHVTRAGRSRRAMKPLVGSYSSPDARRENADVNILLTGPGGVAATAGSNGVVVLRGTGKWSADASANVWVLGLTAQYNRVGDLPRLILPSQGVPGVVGYRRVGRDVQLLNPATREPLTLLRRR